MRDARSEDLEDDVVEIAGHLISKLAPPLGSERASGLEKVGDVQGATEASEVGAAHGVKGDGRQELAVLDTVDAEPLGRRRSMEEEAGKGPERRRHPGPKRLRIPVAEGVMEMACGPPPDDVGGARPRRCRPRPHQVRHPGHVGAPIFPGDGPLGQPAFGSVLHDGVVTHSVVVLWWVGVELAPTLCGRAGRLHPFAGDYLLPMAIRWDSLLVRHLARSLHRRLEGAHLRAVRLDGERRDLVLLFRETTVVWRLHPTRPTVLVRDAIAPAEGDLRLKARVRAVDTPPDERLVRFELVGGGQGDPATEILVELMGNRLNAAITGGVERTMRHVLVRREGDRPFAVGQRWTPPEPTGRAGADGELTLAEWMALLEEVPPPDRARALVRGVAWASPLNAETFLEPTLEDGYEAWRRMVGSGEEGGHSGEEQAYLLATDRGLQPYPFALAGVDSRPVANLLTAVEKATEDHADGTPAGPALAVPPSLMARLEDAIAHEERRISALRTELDGREDPSRLRSVGDLILARFSELPAGADIVTLTGFDGELVEVALDPELRPDENAASYYDRAARSERAAERIPRLVEKVEQRLARLTSLRATAVEGTVDVEALRRELPTTKRSQKSGGGGPSLPYRSYRSSGGLEIRVGRGAKHNDDLTFHHSAPDDIWLHARHTAGAHVILRWTEEGNPPARDLAQAGVLAALHSKARTSTSVPVDWTRRKYVRKPRGSAPGSVVPDRVQTVFVRPDERLLESLADEG